MSSITFKSDIIKELSQELNIPEKEIEEIVNINIDYIKKSAVEKDYLLISLPRLCKLRFNFKLGENSLNYQSHTPLKKELIRKKVNALGRYKLKDRNHLSLKTPLFEKLWRKMTKSKNFNYIYGNMYKTIEEVEENSNNIIKSIK